MEVVAPMAEVIVQQNLRQVNGSSLVGSSDTSTTLLSQTGDFCCWKDWKAYRERVVESGERAVRRKELLRWIVTDIKPQYRIDLTYAEDTRARAAVKTLESFGARLADLLGCRLIVIGARELTAAGRIHWHLVVHAISKSTPFLPPDLLFATWGLGRVYLNYLESKSAKWQLLKIRYAVKHALKRSPDGGDNLVVFKTSSRPSPIAVMTRRGEVAITRKGALV